MTDIPSRSLLEQRLLATPFDHDLRLRYAELLLDESDGPGALVQAELLAQQQPDRLQTLLLLARARLTCHQESAALTVYAQARTMEGFAPVEPLESMSARAQRSRGPELQLVGDSGRSSTVVPLQQVSEEKVRFSSIVGMEALKQTIRLRIVEPYLNPGMFDRFRLSTGGGILLYGPPGCGKTMIARAVANECRASFLSVGISDVLNMWLGESERNLAAMFEKARSQVPCVLFFDELDALAYSRAKSGSASARTVVNEFLAQMDGIGRENRGLLILAATNMPWDVDSAIKRPGRFSRQIFVPPPDMSARRAMLEIKLMGVPTRDLDLERLAQRTEHYSGADLDGLIELSKETALADSLARGTERPIVMDDFEQALAQSQPSTLDWLRTVRNVVKYAADDSTYRDVESYLKQAKLLR